MFIWGTVYENLTLNVLHAIIIVITYTQINEEHRHTHTRRVTTTTMAEWHSQNQKQKLCLSTITHHTKYYRNALIRELSVCSRKIFKTWNYSVIYFGNKAVSRCGAQTVSTMKIKRKWRVNKTNVRRSYKNFALHLQHRNCVQCSLKGAQYAHTLRTSTHTHTHAPLFLLFFISLVFKLSFLLLLICSLFCIPKKFAFVMKDGLFPGVGIALVVVIVVISLQNILILNKSEEQIWKSQRTSECGWEYDPPRASAWWKNLV